MDKPQAIATMQNFLKFTFVISISLAAIIAKAQSNRLPELRSCMTSEFAVAISENADATKSWNDNVEIGKRLGYIIAEHYQKAIWALDNAEIEGREVVVYAANNAGERIKYMSRDALRSEVNRCRRSFAER